MKGFLAVTALLAALTSVQPAPALAEGQLKVYHWFE